MKKTMFFFVVLFAGLTILATGCKKKDDPKPSSTGGLTVKVKLKGSTGYLTDVLVGLATSQQNLDNSVYLKEKETNAQGVANFGELNPGNYYYDCFHIIGNTEYYGEGQVQIVSGTDLELTLTLE
jgi:hypothetical protein